MRTEIPQRQADARVGFFEHLPGDVISDVQVNEQMKDGVRDPRLLPWLDEDFLVRHAALFALGGIQGEPRLQTPTSHRGVILKKDTFFEDEYGTVFGEIGIKGTGITHNGLAAGRGKRPTSKDPQGFFGKGHSQIEMDLSDQFVEIGGRGGRVLGIITLDPDRLREWAIQGSENRDPFYYFFDSLRRVRSNGDVPALCVRLMGTDRIEDFNNKIQKGYYSHDKIYTRAARLFLAQIESAGIGEFLERYRLQHYYPFVQDLEEIVQHEGMYSEEENDDALKSLAFLQRYFLYWNLSHVRQLSESRHQGTLTYKGSPQDIDTTGNFYDWETSVRDNSQYYPERDSGDHKTIRTMARLWIPNREAHNEVNELVSDAARMGRVTR